MLWIHLIYMWIRIRGFNWNSIGIRIRPKSNSGLKVFVSFYSYINEQIISFHNTAFYKPFKQYIQKIILAKDKTLNKRWEPLEFLNTKITKEPSVNLLFLSFSKVSPSYFCIILLVMKVKEPVILSGSSVWELSLSSPSGTTTTTS